MAPDHNISLKTVVVHESISMIIRPLVRTGSIDHLNPSNLTLSDLELVNFDACNVK